MVYGIPQKNDFNEKIEMMINPGLRELTLFSDKPKCANWIHHAKWG
jgi:hypothetical protein